MEATESTPFGDLPFGNPRSCRQLSRMRAGVGRGGTSTALFA